MRVPLRLLHLLALLLLAWAAFNIRTPYLHKFGESQLLLFLICCAALALRSKRTVRRAVLAISLLAIANESQFRIVRARVLSAPPADLARLGRHVITGYDDADQIRSLADQRALGGVYLTHRNVRGRSIAAIRAEIDRLAVPYVAADHEGGPVAWLSPPLPAPASLATFARGDAELDVAAIEHEARSQAAALASVGVNLNFAPVVDLSPDRDPAALDIHTRISERAIGRDPERVTAVARIYAEALAREGVMPTLKHFPGLARVAEDTHHFAGRLEASVAELEARDWIPFRAVAGGAFVMVGHVQLDAVDATQPASLSKPVIDGIIRHAWRHDGVLITDDLCMAPTFYAEGGVGESAVRALNAGVDLLLVSYDHDQWFRVMDALLEADREGRLDPAMLSRSRGRLDRVLTARTTSTEIATCDRSSDRCS